MSEHQGVATPELRFERRRDWSREEWIVAFDACPKDRQRYSATSRDVLEVAYLINRTPAAVSRSFANLWAAMTSGREGLINYAELCGQVVAEYRRDFAQLHRDALSLRTRFLSESLAPRLEARAVEGGPLFASDLRQLSSQIARETGIPRRLFVLYRRQGSLLEGVVLVLFGALAAPLGERFIRWVESHLRRPGIPEHIEILRSQTWVDLSRGDYLSVERRVILRYLPAAQREHLSARSRTALARYLTALLGVTPVANAIKTDSRRRVSASRKREIESRIGSRLHGLPGPAFVELDALLQVADTEGLRSAIRVLHQTRLDDFEGK